MHLKDNVIEQGQELERGVGEAEVRKTRSGGKSQIKTGKTGLDQKRLSEEITEAQAKEVISRETGRTNIRA